MVQIPCQKMNWLLVPYCWYLVSVGEGFKIVSGFWLQVFGGYKLRI